MRNGHRTEKTRLSGGCSRLKAASVMFATIPIVRIQPCLQRYIINGLTVGSIKG